MTWDQVQTLTLLYQVVERLIFRWIGDDRENNIFCVPLHQTAITYSSIGAGPDPGNFRNWEKYTALNFLPMFTQGTVEWRHMAGHCDETRILLWCNIIGAMFAWAKRTPLDVAKQMITELNTSSAYEMFMYDVFTDLMACFVKEPDYKQLLEDGVLDVKYSIYNKKATKPAKKGVKFVRVEDMPPLRPEFDEIAAAFARNRAVPVNPVRDLTDDALEAAMQEVFAEPHPETEEEYMDRVDRQDLARERAA